MREALDFDAINQAALAAFPAVLARLLPRGKNIGRELVALNPRRPDRNLGASKSIDTTAGGAISPLATRAAIRFLVAYLADVSQGEAARLLAQMLGFEPGGGAMDNPLDPFAPLTEAELADAARQLRKTSSGRAEADLPSARRRKRRLAAARLFSRKPDMFWRYETAEAKRRSTPLAGTRET